MLGAGRVRRHRAADLHPHRSADNLRRGHDAVAVGVAVAAPRAGLDDHVGDGLAVPTVRRFPLAIEGDEAIRHIDLRMVLCHSARRGTVTRPSCVWAASVEESDAQGRAERAMRRMANQGLARGPVIPGSVCVSELQVPRALSWQLEGLNLKNTLFWLECEPLLPL